MIISGAWPGNRGHRQLSDPSNWFPETEDEVVPSIFCLSELNRLALADFRQPAHSVACQKPVFQAGKTTDIRSVNPSEQPSPGRKEVNMAAFRRRNRILRTIAAKGIASRISPNGHFLGDGRICQFRIFSQADESKQWRSCVRVALPLRSEGDCSVWMGQKVTYGVQAQLGGKFDLIK